MSPVFHFKQFSIRHDRSIMKVGTDGVLLGAYAGVSGAESILDIGTGSGLIAIMLAQRSHAMIRGVEIDEGSAAQAKQNALNCPWASRIFIQHDSFMDFFPLYPSAFDCVVCNPPFFEDQLKSPDDKKNLARHSLKLTFPELIRGTKQVLKADGRFWIILPLNETLKFIEAAKAEGYFLFQHLTIYPKSGKAAHRSILALSLKNDVPLFQDSLTIRDTEGGFTEEYKQLTRDFYLKF